MEVNPYLSAAERRILGRAVVGIAGAGGLGSNCAMHLVRSGVRRLVIADFEYSIDRHDNRYGWGIARYTTPETLYGPLRTERTPAESFERICEHLRRLFPDAAEDSLLKTIVDFRAV